MIKTSNTRVAANGIDRVRFFSFVCWRQLVCNYGSHVILCQKAEGSDALLKTRDIRRLKNEETDERCDVASSNESWTVLHQIVLRHGWTVPIVTDIMSDKIHAIGTEETLLE